MKMAYVLCLFFFFQAEDGIRDLIVTGVQTCALPIFEGQHLRRWQLTCRDAETCRPLQSGLLKIDEMVTTTYSLENINDGYADMLDGKNIRGVIKFSEADW